VGVELFHADGKTDVKNVAFRNFPNVSARGKILKKINDKIKE